MPAPRIELLAPEAADDERLVSELVRLINSAYAAGEAGLWLEGAPRTDDAEIAAAIRGEGMLVATVEGRIVGCGGLRPVDTTTTDLGLVSAAPEVQGSGVGRQLLQTAEGLARERGTATMQLQLLVPRDGTHPAKERLRQWYLRLGYRIERSVPFEEAVPHAAPSLATPCDILVFRKPFR